VEIMAGPPAFDTMTTPPFEGGISIILGVQNKKKKKKINT
jgi:hypothetical protein